MNSNYSSWAKRLSLAVAVSLFIAPAFGQYKTKTFIYDTKEAQAREHSLDVSHVLIDVSFEPSKGLVKGKVSHTVTPIQNNLDSVFFDAPGITIKEALLNGVAVKYSSSSQGVSVFPSPALTWDKTYTITFVYEAQPRLGLYFIGWNDASNLSRKQIWTQGQAYDNRYWVPLYDKQNDKATSEVIVKFDAAYKVLSNGNKIQEKDNKDGTKTWQYRMVKPHSTYLIMLGIGKYEIKTVKSQSGVPINLWYYPEFPERADWTYKYSAEMMDWFEKELMVKYPWNTYSQIPVQDYTFGAMENTSATLFGDFYLVDEGSYLDRSYVYVNAHELTHQWFGDLITERSETHHWLHENFATYYGNLYTGTVRGMDYYEWSRKTSIDQALDASKKDIIPIAHSDGGTVRHYPKGAVMLDMLRYVAGDEAFRRTMKYFLEKHAYQNVDSEDLLIAFHEKTGLSLDWFWEEWIYRGAEPKYNVSFREVADLNGNRNSEFTITQTHEVNDLTNYFKMPIVFEVYYKDGSVESKKVLVENYMQIVSLPNKDKKEIDFVLFDPNMKIMKSVTFNKPFAMLAAQALRAPYMLDRYDALVAMKAIPLAQKQETLLQAYDKEKFFATKSEIITQLANQTDEKSTALIIKALNDADVDVRKAALSNIKRLTTELIPQVEKLLLDKSYIIVEQALDKLCALHPSQAATYLEQTKSIVGTRGSNVRIKWLEIQAFRDLATYAPQLAVYASPSYEFLTRGAAINSFKKLNYFDTKVVEYIFDAALNANNKLSGDGVAAIKYFYGQLAYKKIIDNYNVSQTWLPWQKEILTKAGL